jgi:hypothetical protein
MAVSNLQIDDDFRRRYPYQHPFTNLHARSRAKRGCEGGSKNSQKACEVSLSRPAEAAFDPPPAPSDHLNVRELIDIETTPPEAPPSRLTPRPIRTRSSTADGRPIGPGMRSGGPSGSPIHLKRAPSK